MTILALLGFTNISALPLNDKFLHFLCFSIATAVFYFIVDVEECVINISISPLFKFFYLGAQEGYGSGGTVP